MPNFLLCVAAAYSAFCALKTQRSRILKVHFASQNVNGGEGQLFVSVSFAVLVRSTVVFFQFLLEHGIHVHGGASQATCI